MELHSVFDPYIDPESGILRNLVGAVNIADLQAAESDLTTARTIQVQNNFSVKASRDLQEIKSLHRHLFQDLFEWAGELRTIDMRRGDGQHFAPWKKLKLFTDNFSIELASKNYLQNLERENFIHLLAYFYDLLNTGGSTLI